MHSINGLVKFSQQSPIISSNKFDSIVSNGQTVRSVRILIEIVKNTYNTFSVQGITRPLFSTRIRQM
jgi:hypothetical protein